MANPTGNKKFGKQEKGQPPLGSKTDNGVYVGKRKGKYEGNYKDTNQQNIQQQREKKRAVKADARSQMGTNWRQAQGAVGMPGYYISTPGKDKGSYVSAGDAVAHYNANIAAMKGQKSRGKSSAKAGTTAKQGARQSQGIKKGYHVNKSNTVVKNKGKRK